MAISELSRVRTELDPLLVIPSLTHHPAQVHRQSPGHRDFGGFPSSPHHEVAILATTLRLTAHRDLRGFHQQEAQQHVALLADVSQSAPIAARLLLREPGSDRVADPNDSKRAQVGNAQTN